MLGNLLKSLEPNVRITSIVILCIVSTLILIPIMAEEKINFYTFILNSSSDIESFHLNTHEMNIVSQDMYIPPNFGAPASQHGTGTR
ncbi:hypothetical protein H6G06_01425 [Anabaena sphaerica FACHB-251]|uniref:Uncharacterized protein n=1 Tax=Anabaena sphaerica FACHB-251 TaxID=2692883 RepID=A0A926WD21_9NOST|nr:hypothetical protein [Anabaena sphaerica]MBD2292173.1 hypothetical protein [Anabaena sphaerica FACHB-251]